MPSHSDYLENKPEFQRVWAGKSLNTPIRTEGIKNQYYFGCNSFVDDEIGRVLEAALKYAPDAYIIYTSDHGDFLGTHQLSGKGPAAYDDIARIPFIISGPGIEHGSVSPHPVSHINIAPTVMEWMGIPVPDSMHGKSLTPQLADPDTRVNDYVFYGFGRYEADHDGFGGFQPMRVTFDGRYKLAVNLLSTDELYDMDNDPYEMINLIENPVHSKARDRLHDALLTHQDETRDPFRGYYWEYRPWRKDANGNDTGRTGKTGPTWHYTGMTRQRIEDEMYEPRQLDYDDGLPITEAVRRKFT
jgi:uncharacterized sulfatase